LKDSAEEGRVALTGESWRGSRPSSCPTACAQPDPEQKSEDVADRKPQEGIGGTAKKKKPFLRGIWTDGDGGTAGDGGGDGRVLARSRARRPPPASRLYPCSAAAKYTSRNAGMRGRAGGGEEEARRARPPSAPPPTRDCFLILPGYNRRISTLRPFLKLVVIAPCLAPSGRVSKKIQRSVLLYVVVYVESM
jgi:hypothetical protein